MLAQAWSFRDGVALKCSAAEQVAQDLSAILHDSGTHKVLDLGSGSGGPIKIISSVSALAETEFVLSDLFPNIPAFEKVVHGSKGRVSYCKEPVDATDCPGAPGRARTMFASMHHMPETLLEGILRSCVASKETFIAFEATNRSLPVIVFFLMSLPLLAILHVCTLAANLEFLKALRCFVFLPVLGLILVHDGIVSCLRTYSRQEFLEIASRADAKNEYRWYVSERALEGVFWIPLTVYVGMPTH
jgi:hypothetical protein